MEIEKLTERINFLYKKSKEEGLTKEELEEQQSLRKIYIERVKTNLRSQLNGIERKGSN
ncbi:DUF896 domain-containing protein [Clostridium polynesiense]|uniref:DUF896 domain-containing protein n=1 Tax=Clostridium polynesiense TaxID=1325933 RepID=UPI0009E39067|nr:DUF896 domain-containing protein [Clostridium polynesiense]